jgi:hypothetical protein
LHSFNVCQNGFCFIHIISSESCDKISSLKSVKEINHLTFTYLY